MAAYTPKVAFAFGPSRRRKEQQGNAGKILKK
jgi:hypothetical protein